MGQQTPHPRENSGAFCSVWMSAPTLRVTKERLQTTTEELESSNEELKSSNEELQSINEELQSANEELETSKEELQSINEELQTVNSELNARVDELSRANNDMSNLLESTQIATVFLDRGLNVKRFTPAAKDLFHLVESDAGRPITHVRPRFASETMQEDAERVLRTLTPIERRVSGAEDERRYIMRTLPYRTTENVINGVVMTFTDITQITQAETKIEELTHDLRARISELETILDLVPVGLMFADSGPNREVLINAHAARLIGVGEHRGLKPAPSGFRLLDSDGELASRDHPLARAAREGAAVTDWQGRLQSERGGELHVMMSATPLFGEAGQVRGAVAAIVDISAHKQAEARQQFLLGELQHRVKNILATVASLAARMSAGRRSVEEFRSAFLARIGAMSRTHDLLTAGAWGGASLLALLKIELEPYATDRKGIRLNGPDVKLSASAAASLGMVFNELATNAAKYGALSQPNGRLEIEWALAHEEKDGTQRIRLTWSEHGGPPVQPLDGKGGFGLSFIARCVEYELGGKADLQLLPEGARFCMEFPLADSVEKPPPVI